MLNTDTAIDWQASWQPLMAVVGRDFGPGGIRWGADCIEAGAIRRYLEPLEIDCPLHDDADVARACGHEAIIAPYTAVPSLSTVACWQPGTVLFTRAGRDAQPDIKSLQPPLPPQAPAFSGYFATDMEVDFVRPVHVGERIGRSGRRLLACQPKATRVGRGAFCTVEIDIVSDRGDLVLRMRTTLFCYNPYPAAEGSLPLAPAAVENPSDVAIGTDADGVADKVAATVAPEPVAGARVQTRYWEDIQVGEALAPLAFPLSLYRLVMAAGANRDFNAIHHNSAFAQRSGAPEAYANNLLLQGMWERSARNFIGPLGRLHQLKGFRMSHFNCAGDTVTVRGEVLRKWRDGAHNYVELKIWSANRDGISVGPGTLLVSMPARTPAGEAACPSLTARA
jgi:acyl dehydratase